MVTETAQGLKDKLENLRAAITQALAAGENADAVMVEYTALLSKYQTAQRSENAVAIDEAKSQVLRGIGGLIDGSGLETLMGESVVAINWSKTVEAGKEPVFALNVNSKRGRASGSATGRNGGGRSTKHFEVNGKVMDAREFVLAHAPEDILDASLVKRGEGKWITKPIHIDKTVEHLKGQGVTVNEVAAPAATPPAEKPKVTATK